MLHTDHANVLAFARDDPEDPRRQVIAVTNFSQDTVSVSILDPHQQHGAATLSASGQHRQARGSMDLERPIVLSPDESYLIDSLT